MEREPEAGHARGYCGRQKERSPAVEWPGSEQPEENHQSRGDPDQANDHVNKRVCEERHAKNHGSARLSQLRLALKCTQAWTETAPCRSRAVRKLTSGGEWLQTKTRYAAGPHRSKHPESLGVLNGALRRRSTSALVVIGIPFAVPMPTT